MRQLSEKFRIALFGPQTDEVIVALVDIEHSSITTMHLAIAFEDVLVGATTYTAFPAEMEFLGQTQERQTSVSVRFSNVDGTILELVRSIDPTSPPHFIVNVVLASDPNTVEIGPIPYDLLSVDVEDAVIECGLSHMMLRSARFPCRIMDAVHTPGLFGSPPPGASWPERGGTPPVSPGPYGHPWGSAFGRR